MTKLKGLFLGSAAAILAVSGAQAADPPAEVWDYVRICDAYGAKYYYIPGTETCLRIGGYVQWRATYTHRERNRGLNEAFIDDPTYFDMLGRARLWLDAREETEWGTLRGYMEFEANSGGSLNMRHAYLQIAGITAGHTSVLMSSLSQGFGPNYGTISGDNGTSRNQLINYTFSFGNGFSFAVGIEESDNTDGNNGIIGVTAAGTAAGLAAGPGAAVGAAATTVATAATGATVGNVAAGDVVPDAAAVFRVEQGWGGFHASGIVRDVRSGTSAGFSGDSEIGWAVRGALRLDLNFLANGGSIGAVGTYTSGASNWAADYAPDAYVQNAGGDLELIETWSARAGLDVGLTPTLTAGVFGGYTTVVDIDDILRRANAATTGAVRHTESWWNTGLYMTWSPLANLDIGLDVIYDHENDRVISAGGNFSDDGRDIWSFIVGATRPF